MSKSFAELGVSRAVRGALSRRGISAPFPVQELVIEDVLTGRDVLVKSPTGSGKTLAFGIPLVERLRPGGSVPWRSSSFRLVSSRPRSWRSSRRWRTPAASQSLPCTAASGSQLRQPGPRKRMCSSRRRVVWRICCSVARSRSTRSASSFWTRPTACSTWASARPLIESPAPAAHERRPSSSQRRSTAWPARSRPATRGVRSPTSTATRGTTMRAASSTGSSRSAPRDAFRPSSTRSARAWPRAGVRAHQARSRSPRQAPQRPRPGRHGDPREQVAAPARTGAVAISGQASGDARCDRCRRQGHRRQAGLACDQLRSTGRRGRLHPSSGAHRPRGAQWRRCHARG